MRDESIETLFQRYTERRVDTKDLVQIEEVEAWSEICKLVEGSDKAEAIVEKLNEFQYLAERAGFYAGIHAVAD